MYPLCAPEERGGRDLGPWIEVPSGADPDDVNTPLPAGVVDLDESRCWALLRAADVGRLAVAINEHPDIFPVNFVVDHGTVVFRTAEGTKLAAAVGHDVAYEVDGIGQEGAVAWSVVIKGRAREVARLHESLEALDLPLRPWHRGPKPRVVRIEPDEVHGRRFTVTLTPEQPPVPRAGDE
jgi:nitroimidazol reductase NimA-like FMN-containing flavoprotein (pyridoxamine 5'-phosphate oxidase superfamily)